MHEFAAKFSGAYFKAGAYTQANAGLVPADASNYGATIYYGLTVVHGPLPKIPAPVPAPTPAPSAPARTSAVCPCCGQPIVLTAAK